MLLLLWFFFTTKLNQPIDIVWQEILASFSQLGMIFSCAIFFYFLVSFSACLQTYDTLQKAYNIKSKSPLGSKFISNPQEFCSRWLSEMMDLSPIFLLLLASCDFLSQMSELSPASKLHSIFRNFSELKTSWTALFQCSLESNTAKTLHGWEEIFKICYKILELKHILKLKNLINLEFIYCSTIILMVTLEIH